MKILFIPTIYPSKKNSVKGIFIKEHAKAASLYNEIVVLYNENCEKNMKRMWKIISDEKEDGIRTIRIKTKKSLIPKTTYILYVWSIISTFRKLLKENWRPDIIHVHIFSAGIPAIILGKIYKIPIVITEHWSGFPRKILKNFNLLKARFIMNKANAILPVSKYLEQNIKNYGIKNYFQIIPNVIDNKIFFPLNKKVNNENKKRILFVGLLTHVKGISYLFKALFELKKKRQDFILDVVGDGENKNEYENLAKKLKLQKIIKFHGLKTKREVVNFMKNCDFFVQPSLYETFGITFIEAMACGKPIVTTNIPVLKEKINKERGILVPPKDINALKKAIDYMLDHYQNYSAEKISQYTKNNFSYKIIGRKINNVYKKLTE